MRHSGDVEVVGRPLPTSAQSAAAHALGRRPARFARRTGGIAELLLLLLCLTVSSAPPLAAQASLGFGSEPRLATEIQRLAAAARGVVGIAAVHLESGRTAYLNPDISFPLGSVVKVPIAVQLLRRVDRGRVRLDSLVVLRDEHVYPNTYGPISEYMRPGSALTIENLLEVMLQVSDNNATDILLLGPAGGPERVTGLMRAAGIEGIRVDRPIWALILNSVGYSGVSLADPISPDSFGTIVAGVRASGVSSAASEAFDLDSRDTATPKAMGLLLSRIWRRQILSDSSSARLLEIMYGCRTGAGRIKGILPPGTRVAHKTGTISRSVNDVGIIELPDGAGHVVTAIFVKESRLGTMEAKEATIAQIARAIYDYFVFNRN